MKGIARKYVEFARRPHVGRLLIVAFLSRMPIGMVAFSMLMFLRESLGDFAFAGLAVGVNFVSMAIAAPIQGRIIDRHGPEKLLRVTAVVSTLALCGVMAATLARMPFTVIALLAATAGVFANPITTLTRTMWRHLFDDEEDRRTAFAMDAVLIEFNFTLGPAIVALMLALFGATAAFGLTICVVAASAVIYVGSGTLELFKRVAATERHLLGPLTEPRLVVVFIAMLGITTGFGILEVGYPAFSTYLGVGAVAGVLLAINSLGSATGGALYGGLQFKAPIERQFAVCMLLMAIPFGAHAAWLQPVFFGVLAFLSGALIAPTLTAHAVLVSRLAPPKYATEAFTWSSTFIVSGLGVGMALGGA
ncbi:MAG TPA: MFS transporter, partial [Usitatibacter sp.]|nr:MFS transporter [Usitatibacter sp.]